MMKKNFHTSVWMLFGLIVLMGLYGCSFFESDNSSIPTGPVSTMSGSSGDMANCYAGRGHGNQLGIYMGSAEFVVNVPAGQYLLTYKTNWGEFNIVFSALDISLLYIGLIENTEVEEISILEGEINADDLKEADVSGNVLLVSWPGKKKPKHWKNVFSGKHGAVRAYLVQAWQMVQSPTIIILPATLVHAPLSRINVNNVSGLDVSGCGAGYSPCRTINQAMASVYKYRADEIVVKNTGVAYNVTSPILVQSVDKLKIKADPGVLLNMVGAGLVFNSSHDIKFENFNVITDFDPAFTVLGSGNVELKKNVVQTAGGRHLLHNASGETKLKENIFTGAAGGTSIERVGILGQVKSEDKHDENYTDGTIVNCGTLSGPGFF